MDLTEQRDSVSGGEESLLCSRSHQTRRAAVNLKVGEGKAGARSRITVGVSGNMAAGRSCSKVQGRGAEAGLGRQLVEEV